MHGSFLLHTTTLRGRSFIYLFIHTYIYTYPAQSPKGEHSWLAFEPLHHADAHQNSVSVCTLLTVHLLQPAHPCCLQETANDC